MKKYTFLLCFFCFVFSAYGQTARISEVSFNYSRGMPAVSRIILRGTNIDVTANYPFAICRPCTQNQLLPLFGNVGSSSYIEGTGTINGKYYEHLYLGPSFTYTGLNNKYIPWTQGRRVVVHSSDSMQGRVYIWEKPEDAGNINRALFIQTMMSGSGNIDMSFTRLFNDTGSNRSFEDSTFTYNFKLSF